MSLNSILFCRLFANYSHFLLQMENEHCMLLALPCGHDHMDVLKQSTNLTNGFITYLQQKQAAGIVNVAAPGTTQPVSLPRNMASQIY